MIGKSKGMYVFGFEKLEVYSEVKKFIKEIYLITLRFPDIEKFGLISQLRRAAISVASNIAEGNSRNSAKDRIHFVNLAYSSLMEVVCQIDIAQELNYLRNEDVDLLRKKIEQIAILINGYRRYQEKQTEK
jgi:four helix bundle protein